MQSVDYLIASIEEIISWGKKAESDCITYLMQGRYACEEPDDDMIDAETRLIIYTEHAAREVCLLAEHLAVPIALNEFKILLGPRHKFDRIDSPHGDDSAHATALRQTEMFFNSLKTMVGKAKAPGLEVFERILYSSAKIISDLNIDPSNETQVRNAVLNVMGYAFPDARKEVNLPQSIKNYRGDIGVISVSAVAEYKFADSKTSAKNCLDGLYADIKSYPIDGAWRHYYAVLYLTEAFYTQKDIEQAFKDVRADGYWTPIVLVGRGARK
ncbi:hypothetical protein [Pseudomonas thivervalensis]|uniref:hypothetical protein n=1 Tax=Pseudomonas thivervalensis TaxID=86265 RepID=UPI003D6C088A